MSLDRFQITDFSFEHPNSLVQLGVVGSTSIPNSEMVMKPTIEILDECSGCGACVEICPVLCLKVCNGLLEIVNEEVCFGCRKCEDVCPEEAIHIKGIVP